MTEFASVAMMKVITRGMTELGIVSEATGQVIEHSGSIVDISIKRALINRAIELGGVRCLIKLGQGVHYFVDEPSYQALISLSNPYKVLMRWQKLERYIHSSHRINIVECGHNFAKLHHTSNVKNHSPSLAEHLVVAGVLAALLEAAGAKNVSVLFNSLPVYPNFDESTLSALAFNEASSKWVFRWDSVNLILQRNLDDKSANFVFSPDWPDIAKQVGRILASDLILPATLDDVARKLATSSRSLQRKLLASGFNYSGILNKARSSVAAKYLLDSSTSIAEVGYLAGYSDQAHFTRDFKMRVGLTPALYRKDFCFEEGKGEL